VSVRGGLGCGFVSETVQVVRKSGRVDECKPLPDTLALVEPVQVPPAPTWSRVQGGADGSAVSRQCYAVLVGGSNWDGAWRGLVTIVESIHRRPYICELKLQFK